MFCRNHFEKRCTITKTKTHLAMFISCMPTIHQNHLRWNISKWLSNYFPFCFIETADLFEYRKFTIEKTSMAIDIILRGWKHDILSCTERSQVKYPLLYMVAREVKYNGLPVISYFPARATIFRHNTFFSSMRIEIWLLSYMRWFNRLHLYYANFYIR